MLIRWNCLNTNLIHMYYQALSAHYMEPNSKQQFTGSTWCWSNVKQHFFPPSPWLAALVHHWRQCTPLGMLWAQLAPQWLQALLAQTFHSHAQLVWHCWHLTASHWPGGQTCHADYTEINQIIKSTILILNIMKSMNNTPNITQSLAASGGPGSTCTESMSKYIKKTTFTNPSPM